MTKRDACVVITETEFILYPETLAADRVPYAFYGPYRVSKDGILTFTRKNGIDLACDMTRNGLEIGIIRGR